MQAEFHSSFPDPGHEPDDQALAVALRPSLLRELTEEAQRLHLDSKRALVVHQAASERMALAIEEARARLAQARVDAARLPRGPSP